MRYKQRKNLAGLVIVLDSSDNLRNSPKKLILIDDLNDRLIDPAYVKVLSLFVSIINDHCPFFKETAAKIAQIAPSKNKTINAIFPPLEPFLVAIDTIPETNFHVFIFKFSLLYLTILN